MLNKALVIEITKAFIVSFIKARNSLVFLFFDEDKQKTKKTRKWGKCILNVNVTCFKCQVLNLLLLSKEELSSVMLWILCIAGTNV